MATMHVEVVSADHTVWSGEATNVIAKTVEGDIGILPGHEPVLAVIVPSGVEIYTEEHNREIIVAVGHGFISVADGRVSILAEFAQLAEEITLEAAERERDEAWKRLEDEPHDEDARKHYEHADAQVRAARKAQ